MNELMTMKNIKTMTSLEIAEITNKDHKNIIRDIKDEISKLGTDRGQLIFEPAEYFDRQGKPRPMFNVTLDGVLQLGARYDAVIRFGLIQRVKELQVKVKIPTTMKEALEIALILANENEELKGTIEIQTQLIEENKPKLEYLDMILESEDTMTISQIAADYGMSGKALNKTLHEQGFIRNVNKQWILYKEHMNKGYTKSDTFIVRKDDGTEKVIPNTKYTQKGRLKIHELLTNLGIISNFDKENKIA